MTATAASATAADITITSPSLTDIVALRRLFRIALQIDFQYFPAAYAKEIGAQNNLLHLALGRYQRDRVILVAKRAGHLIGYAIGSLTPQGGGELYWLYVDRPERRRKVGVQLLHAAIHELRRRGAGSINLVTYDLKDYYARQGFHYRGQQHIHGLDLDVMEYPADGKI
jgi:GNAT superfamily N-acetyltransferase